MEISNLDSLEKESIRRQIPIIRREKGEWLLNLVKEKKPKRVLELGTANGYSGIILGSEGAQVITIDRSVKAVEEATKNFSDFGTNAWILTGDGALIISDMVKTKKKYFDLIFVDFAKKEYIKVYEYCIEMLKDDGVLIFDDINMEKCADFKEKLLADSRLETEVIELGNGMSKSKKKN